MKPDDAAAYKQRGAAYKDLKKTDEALADYDKAIQLNPNDGYAYINRANIFIEKNDLEKAKADYQKIIDLKLEPDLVQKAQEQLNQFQ